MGFFGRRDERLADIEVTVKHQTEKAWLVYSHLTGKEAWVPKSVGELADGVLTLPESYAQDKELI